MQSLRQANPRRQGDLGEIAAAEWLTRSGYGVWIPLCHSPDVDLLAQTADEFLRIKDLDPARYDYLFVLAADGRKWFIPASEVGGTTAVLLGGPKYAQFEVDAPGS